MVAKYSDIDRIRVPGFPERGKKYMSDGDLTMLLDGEVIIEEKLDGTTESWDYDDQYIIFAEDMRYKHTVKYSKLPSRYIIFDVWESVSRCWLDRYQKERVSRQANY